MTSATDLLTPTSRVALAAMLYDIGKFAERAGAFDGHAALADHLLAHSTFHQDGSWFSPRHVAITQLALGAIKSFLPDYFATNYSPLSGGLQADTEYGSQTTDSRLNTAAVRQKPEALLEWLIATADKIALGLEKEDCNQYKAVRDEQSGLNSRTSRQFVLFEKISLDATLDKESSNKWRYPLRPLSPTGIFPQPAIDCESENDVKAKQEYRRLWDAFQNDLARIPVTHRAAPALWLDHFDSLWLSYTHAMPSATASGMQPDVSLYDHAHTTAALAASLWRWHEETGETGPGVAAALVDQSDFGVQKFLIVQGDFFGIQEFIFSQGGETRRQAAKLLRGRSFQVSLFTELAALKVLDVLGLPPTSQIINAAGKFLILAPNTPETVRQLGTLRAEFDQWFLQHTFGLAGIGLAWEPASSADFIGKKYGELSERIHLCLERSKHARFALCDNGAHVFSGANYPFGPCAWNGRLPADNGKDGDTAPSCALSRDQILIGRALTEHDRILVVPANKVSQLPPGARLKRLEVPIFGYALAFTDAGEATGGFGELAAEGSLLRCWDYSLPEADVGDTLPWHGSARRNISGHVPRMQADDLAAADRYEGAATDGMPQLGDIKTLDMLACEDRLLAENGTWRGIAALGILKGDVDNLGELFRAGLSTPSFARHAALSRQVNAFFTLWLPHALGSRHRNVYTVFAGGDDFFLIGPWRSIQALAGEMRDAFSRYATGNPELHFSAGIATQKAGAPIASLAGIADDALAAAKALDGKDAVTCFGETVHWAKWPDIEAAIRHLDELRDEFGGSLSTGYVYSLLQFVEARAREEHGDANAAMWRSRFAYRTRRFVIDRLKERDEQRRRERYERIAEQIAVRGIHGLGSAYRIALYSYLYRARGH